MTDTELIRLAEAAGFHAAVIDAKDVPTKAEFRKYCEENLCGNYNANYACPPGCGSAEEVIRQLADTGRALVLQNILELEGRDPIADIQNIRRELNLAILRLADQLRKAGLPCFSLGYGGCPLCRPCKQAEGKPCAFPEQRISCMSAYCIDVGALAETCGLEFAWVQDRLYLFGMIAFQTPA